MDAVLPLISRKWRSPLNPHLPPHRQQQPAPIWPDKAQQAAHTQNASLLARVAGCRTHLTGEGSWQRGMNSLSFPTSPAGPRQKFACGFFSMKSFDGRVQTQLLAALPLAETKCQSQGEPIVFETDLTSVPGVFYEWLRFIHGDTDFLKGHYLNISKDNMFSKSRD